MEKINLNLDPKHFPQINRRYSPDRIRYLLVNMCQGLQMEITEENLNFLAANVESDLRHIFA